MRPLAGVLKVEFLDRVGQRWTKPPLRRRLELLQVLSALFDVSRGAVSPRSAAHSRASRTCK